MNGIYNTECNKSMSDFSEERKQELFTSMEILVMNCLKENTDYCPCGKEIVVED